MILFVVATQQRQSRHQKSNKVFLLKIVIKFYQKNREIDRESSTSFPLLMNFVFPFFFCAVVVKLFAGFSF